MLEQIGEFLSETGYAHFVLGFVVKAWRELVMIAVVYFLYLAIRKHEPLLLIPIVRHASGQPRAYRVDVCARQSPEWADFTTYTRGETRHISAAHFPGIGALTDFGP